MRAQPFVSLLFRRTNSTVALAYNRFGEATDAAPLLIGKKANNKLY